MLLDISKVLDSLPDNGFEKKSEKRTKIGENFTGDDKQNSREVVFPLKEGNHSVIDKGSFKFRICKRETLEKKIFRALFLWEPNGFVKWLRTQKRGREVVFEFFRTGSNLYFKP